MINLLVKNDFLRKYTATLSSNVISESGNVSKYLKGSTSNLHFINHYHDKFRSVLRIHFISCGTRSWIDPEKKDPYIMNISLGF